MMNNESGLSRAVVFAIAVPVMLYETGARVSVIQTDDLDPGTAAVQDRGLFRIARGDCRSLSSLVSALQLAGALYRWHALPEADRRTMQREAERVRAKGDARAAFHQASDAEIIVGQALRGEAVADLGHDKITHQLGVPEVARWGWFFGPVCYLCLLPLAAAEEAVLCAMRACGRSDTS